MNAVCDPVPLNTCRVIVAGAPLEPEVTTVGSPLASNAKNEFARWDAVGSSMFRLPSVIGILMVRSPMSLICWIWMVADNLRLTAENAAPEQRDKMAKGLRTHHLRDAALLANGDDRTDQVLVEPHAPGDTVHDDADALLRHAARP